MPAELAIGAAAGAFTDIMNQNFQMMANAQSRDFSREMYEKQKADNLAFWHLQNAYNSPEQQMQRFRAAGLNPHLIYGRGDSGNAGSLSAPSPLSAQFRSPEFRFDPLAAISAVYDLDIKAATADNLREQNEVIKQEALLRTAQTLATTAQADRSKFDLALESQLRNVSLDARKEQLRQMKVSTDLSLNRDAREAAMNSSNLAEAAERLITMREQRRQLPLERERLREVISQLKRDNVLRDMDIELRRNGINPSDPMWARFVARMLGDWFSSPDSGSGGPSLMQSIWNYFNK